MFNTGKIQTTTGNPKRVLEQTSTCHVSMHTIIKLIKQSGLRLYVKIKEPFFESQKLYEKN